MGTAGEVDAWIEALLAGIAAIGAWRFLLAFVAMFAETSLFLGLLVPGDTVVLLTATVNRTPLDFVVLLVCVVAGSLAGESVGYALGFWFGPRLRMSRLGRRIGERQWLRAELRVQSRGGPAIFVSRFLPVFHALTPVTVGMTGFPYRRFLLWTVPACLLWASAYVSIGTAAGSGFRRLSQQLHFAGWIVLAAIALVLVAMALVKRVLHRREERAEAVREAHSGDGPGHP